MVLSTLSQHSETRTAAAIEGMQRWRPLIGIAVIGSALSCLAFALAWQVDDQRIRSVFELRAQWRAQDLEAKIAAASAPVEAVATFVDSTDKLTPEQFYKLTSRTLDDGDASRVFTWAPYIQGAERASFELSAEADGRGPFTITDRGSDGALTPAPQRDAYLPIWLEQHGPASTNVLRGIDILSDPARRRTVEQALETGFPTANPPLKSLTGPTARPRYLVVWPVYSGDGLPASLEQRRARLRGVVVGGSDFLSMLTTAIHDTPKIIEDICIFVDGQLAPSDQPIAIYHADNGTFTAVQPGDMDQETALTATMIERQFSVLGRQWRLAFRFTQANIDHLRSQTPWLWLAAGLLLTTLAAALADRERQTRLRVERLAADRTRELSASNLALKKEFADRERAEVALQLHASLLKKTLEASPVAIVHLGPDGNVLVWNRGAENMFGFSAAEALGRPYPIVSEAEKAEYQALLGMLREGKPVRDRSVVRRHKDGRLLRVSVSAEGVFEGDVFQGEVVVFEDMTQRDLLEAQLRQAQKMEAVGQLTGGLAHDFNNLLLVILGNLGLLSETRPDDAEVAEICREARDAAMRGADLIRSLLAFARQQPLKPARMDISALIAGQRNLLQRTIGERIELTINLTSNLWSVMVDGAQLEAALLNLASNARDAMPKGGRLTISTMNRRLDADYAASHPEVTPGDHAVIEISDTGDGMPPDVVSHIFEPFFTTKEKGLGTGLGLSMVFGFMKQSGGHIHVYSEPGAGTTFRLFLPRSYEAAVEEELAAPLLIDIARGESVLLVEDNDSIRRLAARQLTQLGYRVQAVSQVEDALAHLEAGKRTDLVFTDIVMPGKADGIDLARIVRERWPAVKILLTSGFPNSASISEDVAALGVSLISKPYQRDELAHALRNALDGNDQ